MFCDVAAGPMTAGLVGVSGILVEIPLIDVTTCALISY